MNDTIATKFGAGILNDIVVGLQRSTGLSDVMLNREIKDKIHQLVSEIQDEHPESVSLLSVLRDTRYQEILDDVIIEHALAEDL